MIAEGIITIVFGVLLFLIPIFLKKDIKIGWFISGVVAIVIGVLINLGYLNSNFLLLAPIFWCVVMIIQNSLVKRVNY